MIANPTLLKPIARNIGNHMANWEVIALVSGEIEAVSDPAARARPGAHEWIVWQGTAADKAEALQCAEKAYRRVDLEWMRIRYEREGAMSYSYLRATMGSTLVARWAGARQATSATAAIKRAASA